MLRTVEGQAASRIAVNNSRLGWSGTKAKTKTNPEGGAELLYAQEG